MRGQKLKLCFSSPLRVAQLVPFSLRTLSPNIVSCSAKVDALGSDSRALHSPLEHAPPPLSSPALSKPSFASIFHFHNFSRHRSESRESKLEADLLAKLNAFSDFVGFGLLSRSLVIDFLSLSLSSKHASKQWFKCQSLYSHDVSRSSSSERESRKAIQVKDGKSDSADGLFLGDYEKPTLQKGDGKVIVKVRSISSKLSRLEDRMS